MATFSYAADTGAQKHLKPRVVVHKFDDGYEQRIAQGLNSQPVVWSLTFAQRSDSDATAIEAFFIARGGVESFDWTPPDSSTSIKVVCREWTKRREKGTYYSLTAEFQQVFEP